MSLEELVGRLLLEPIIYGLTSRKALEPRVWRFTGLFFVCGLCGRLG